MLYLQGVRKVFGDQLVLDIPEWSIPSGTYWIQGENGAGKSTLFKILSGMLSFEGQILLNNQFDLRKHPIEYRRLVSMVEAEPQYPSFLTPRNLISFTAEIREASQDQIDQLITAFGIDNFLDQPISACSSGMIKKVSLVMAFLGNTSLIILDEPLITIDKESRKTLYQLIRERTHLNTSFLISSHQVFSAEEIHLKATFIISNHRLTESSSIW